MKWKTAWNRFTIYVLMLAGIALAIFIFTNYQQPFLRIVFVVLAVIYLIINCIFLLLTYRK